MLFKIWNGIDSINGVNADNIRKDFGDNTLALFYTIDNVIERIEDINTLRSVFSLSKEEYPSDEDVCIGYLNKMKMQEEVEQEPTQKEIYDVIKAIEATNDEILYNMLFASNEDADI